MTKESVGNCMNGCVGVLGRVETHDATNDTRKFFLMHLSKGQDSVQVHMQVILLKIFERSSKQLARHTL